MPIRSEGRVYNSHPLIVVCLPSASCHHQLFSTWRAFLGAINANPPGAIKKGADCGRIGLREIASTAVTVKKPCGHRHT